MFVSYARATGLFPTTVLHSLTYKPDDIVCSVSDFQLSLIGSLNLGYQLMYLSLTLYGK